MGEKPFNKKAPHPRAESNGGAKSGSGANTSRCGPRRPCLGQGGSATILAERRAAEHPSSCRWRPGRRYKAQHWLPAEQECRSVLTWARIRASKLGWK